MTVERASRPFFGSETPLSTVTQEHDFAEKVIQRGWQPWSGFNKIQRRTKGNYTASNIIGNPLVRSLSVGNF